MNNIRKLLFFIFLFFALIHSHIWAKEKKTGFVDSSVRTLNNAGNNDAMQEGVSRIGEGISKGGQRLVNQAYGYGLTNPNIPGSKVDAMVKTGVRVFANGKAIEYVAKAAPHVGWMASTAGKLDAGDRTGAAITATNGLARTVAIGWAGAAAGTAVVGTSVAAAPVALGFVVACGAAYTAGKIWDYTIGYGADVLDQKVHNLKAELAYGQTPLASAQRNLRRIARLDKKGHEIKDKKQQDSKREEIRKKVEVADRERQNRMQEKYEEEKKRTYEAQQARERELDTQEARERLRERIAEIKKGILLEKAKNLSDNKKKYEDMSTDEKHKALKNNDDEAWDGLTDQLRKDLGLTEDEKEKISQLSGVISGGWSGKDKDGWKAKGTFKMRISSSGRVTGKYSGDDSGVLRGFINSSGRMDIKMGGGSVDGGGWSGTIRKTESGGLIGSGSWKAQGFHGGWRGSRR